MYQTEVLGQSLSSGIRFSFAKPTAGTTRYPCKSHDSRNRPEVRQNRRPPRWSILSEAGRTGCIPIRQTGRDIDIGPRERVVGIAPRGGLKSSRHRSVDGTQASEDPDKTLPATSAAKDAGGGATAVAGAVQAGVAAQEAVMLLSMKGRQFSNHKITTAIAPPARPSRQTACIRHERRVDSNPRSIPQKPSS